MFEHAFIPYGAYWCSPFCRWQGALAGQHSLVLGARVARAALATRNVALDALDGLVLGFTIPQHHALYGAPWVAAMMGAPSLGGPTVSQACATSARMLAVAAAEVETGQRECLLALGCDRTSNGPHIYYPNPGAAGGTGDAENWVTDNFNHDPHAAVAMIDTAENVARAAGVGREQQDEMTLLRYRQYQDALAGDRAFQRRVMVPVVLPAGKKEIVVEADEGVFPTTQEGLARLRPVIDGGSVTYGSQTHPADGNAGLIVCTRDRARALSRDAVVTVRLLAFGEARVEKGMMPTAVVPAARAALARAGLSVGDCRAVKTHNPFAVNDVYFCREMGIPPERVNRYGSSLVWGHPQGPTGLRSIIELIEELHLAGGGHGLFSGCAAGDTAMAVVVKVG
jgi:acetyl-CoA acetyltransferase family protein